MTLHSVGGYGDGVTVAEGAITLGNDAFGGQLYCDGSGVYLEGGAFMPVKISSQNNLSIDAGSGYTVYVGASKSAPNDVTIGQPGRSVSVDAPLRPMRGIVFNTNSYGYSLPGSGTTGQVFYLLEG